MHYVFLMNYFADRKKSSELEKAIHKLGEKREGRVHICRTEYAGHAKELAAEYSERFRSDAVIFACGGDGTVHEVANALAFGPTPMAVLPMGSGNDFARSVLPKEYCDHPARMIDRIDDYEVRSVDMIRVDCYDALSNYLPEMSRYSMNITSFGLDTMVNDIAQQIIKKTRRKSFFRKNAYTISILKCFITGWKFQMRYSFELADRKETADGQMKFCLSCVCNGSYYGNGFCPAPDAKIDDGILKVCLVEDISRGQALPLVSKYKKGELDGHPKMKTFQVTSGVFSSMDGNTDMRGNYDGEDFSANQIRFEVVPRAIPFAFFSI